MYAGYTQLLRNEITNQTQIAGDMQQRGSTVGNSSKTCILQCTNLNGCKYGPRALKCCNYERFGMQS